MIVHEKVQNCYRTEQPPIRQTGTLSITQKAPIAYPIAFESRTATTLFENLGSLISKKFGENLIVQDYNGEISAANY